MLLDKTTKEFEDLRNPSWRDVAGAPKRWMDHDGGTIRLTPASAVTVTVGYLESATPMVNAGDFPDTRIADAHQEHLAMAATYILLSQDADVNDLSRANKAFTDFLQFIGVSDGNRKRVPAGR